MADILEPECMCAWYMCHHPGSLASSVTDLPPHACSRTLKHAFPQQHPPSETRQMNVYRKRQGDQAKSIEINLKTQRHAKQKRDVRTTTAVLALDTWSVRRRASPICCVYSTRKSRMTFWMAIISSVELALRRFDPNRSPPFFRVVLGESSTALSSLSCSSLISAAV